MLVVFYGKFMKPCHYAKTAQMVSQQSLTSIINKRPTKFNKTARLEPPLSPLAWSPSLGHWHDPGPSNQTNFLRLCSSNDYRQSIESPVGVFTFNSTEKALKFTIYDYILRLR